MRLPRPFFRLPVRFDVERLRAEVAALPAAAWAMHPNAIEGNSSIRLISVGGGENDDVNGLMQPTAHLSGSPYLRQVLASFGVVWGRSRLMRLAPGAGVPQHADINYHWFSRVRLHVPVLTRPEVRFICGDDDVHMAAGEAWVFDNWRLHRVEHPTPDERIHLVADTTGTASFWQFVLGSQRPGLVDQIHRYDANLAVTPLTERTTLPAVMHPAEVELLLLDFRTELVAREESPDPASRLPAYHVVLDGFCRDWRQLYLLYGDGAPGWAEFARLRDKLRSASRELSPGLIMRTNRIDAHLVLEARLLRPSLTEADAAPRPTPGPATAQRRGPRLLERPTFIVAAPRSGSTLLFETLASSTQIATLGGEAHWLVEELPELRPGAAGVESNRLLAQHCTPAIAEHVAARILERAQRGDGSPATADTPLRFLEKTPKNALRIPFFDRAFPDARFILLWRDPRENLSSIIEAWRSGRFQTYNALDGFDGPWSLLLPPGWQALRGRSLEDIAAFQWDASNRIVLDDLAALAPERWTAVNYADLVSDPQAVARRLAVFIGVEPDASLLERVSAPLPRSRYTHTPPAADKWRSNESLVNRVLPRVAATWQRLQSMSRG